MLQHRAAPPSLKAVESYANRRLWQGLPLKSPIPCASAGHVASVSAMPSDAGHKGPSGDKWIHEIKHDGFRLIARRIGDRVRLQTKQGYDYAERYPLIVEAIQRLKVSSVVIDGEAMCFTGVAQDFDKLWKSHARS